MRRLPDIALAILIVGFAFPQGLNAGFIFSFSTPSSNVLVGDKALVNILIESSDAVTITGIDLGLRTGAGTFVEPKSDFFFTTQQLTNEWDVITTPGEAIYSKSGQSVVLSANNPTLFATVKIDTTGLQVGNQFSVAFDDVVNPNVANNAFNQPISGVTLGNPITFTIVAVPEPSSALLLSVPFAIGLLARRYRKKKCTVVQL